MDTHETSGRSAIRRHPVLLLLSVVALVVGAVVFNRLVIYQPGGPDVSVENQRDEVSIDCGFDDEAISEEPVAHGSDHARLWDSHPEESGRPYNTDVRTGQAYPVQYMSESKFDYFDYEVKLAEGGTGVVRVFLPNDLAEGPSGVFTDCQGNESALDQ